MAGSAVRPEGIRRHNLGLVVEQVHRNGPLTRAELTLRLGLNRSTIGALVSELCGLGLLEESVPGSSDRAGRPSHVVTPRDSGPYAVAVDVDVDRVTVAAIAVGGVLLARRAAALGAAPTPQALAGVVAQYVAQLHGDLPPGSWPVGVGVSIPGTVRAADGVIEVAPNLRWRDAPLGALLAQRLPMDVPVSVGNDADLGVVAEHTRGAARDAADAVYLTGRVGVGAGILVGGRPLRGVGGLAGEIGHTILDPSGPPCHCGGRGCVEGFIGEQALLRLAERSGPTEATVAAVLADARAGRPAETRAVRTVARSLGRVLANLVNLLNPEVIVVGGALAAVFDLAADDVLAALDRQAMAAAREMVGIRVSGLGADSSLIGAGELAFARLLADPLAACASAGRRLREADGT